MDKITEACDLVYNYMARKSHVDVETYLALEVPLEKAVADYAEGFDDDPGEPMSAEEIAKAFISDFVKR